MNSERCDVAVVGGGLAGLTAALSLARRGKRVRLFEQTGELGGRGTTRETAGYRFNLGPHALYRAGAAHRILGELGIPFHGGSPKLSKLLAWVDGRLERLPAGLGSLLSSRFMSAREKLEAARFLAMLPRVDAASLDDVPVAAWLERALRFPAVRDFVAAYVRLSTYANAPAQLSAGVAIRQLKAATANVLYLDGGWQSLVDGLVTAARAEGVEIVSRARVVELLGSQRLEGLALEGGERVTAEGVVLSAPPDACRTLLAGRSPSLVAALAGAVPMRAACLDVAVRRLPRPDRLFALGIRRPLYLSIHSRWAALAPASGATIGLAKYLAPEESGDDARAELEEVLEAVQPGWREAQVEARFFPHLTVTHWLPTAATGGLAGRPPVLLPELPNVCLAGDWVGPEGMLADAALASAVAAARALAPEAGLRAAG